MCQNQSAPLVVILLGLDGKAKSPLGRLWLSWFAEAGCHALTFDSTFTPAFIDISHHGVTGNLDKEASRIVDIINAFISLPEMRDKVTKIGVVGMSYGSLEALVLGQMGHEGRLPPQFKLRASRHTRRRSNWSEQARLLTVGMMKTAGSIH